MKQFIIILVAALAVSLFFTSPVHAKTAAAACPPDSVLVGRTCVDKYEASVWDLSGIPVGKAKTSLIASIKAGTATEASLLAAGAVQRGVSSDDYPCDNNGNDCTTIFAVSIPGVTPSSFITWFQAQQAAANSGKRLLTNAEWQMAAAGTPDTGGADNGSTTCNTDNLGPGRTDTGSRSNCVSRFGVFDMVGNLNEWVADWVPLSTACVTPLFAGDDNCLAGASTTAGPAALRRGGLYDFGSAAGVFAVYGTSSPSNGGGNGIGFRAGR